MYNNVYILSKKKLKSLHNTNITKKTNKKIQLKQKRKKKTNWIHKRFKHSIKNSDG